MIKSKHLNNEGLLLCLLKLSQLRWRTRFPWSFGWSSEIGYFMKYILKRNLCPIAARFPRKEAHYPLVARQRTVLKGSSSKTVLIWGRMRKSLHARRCRAVHFRLTGPDSRLNSTVTAGVIACSVFSPFTPGTWRAEKIGAKGREYIAQCHYLKRRSNRCILWKYWKKMRKKMFLDCNILCWVHKIFMTTFTISNE